MIGTMAGTMAGITDGTTIGTMDGEGGGEVDGEDSNPSQWIVKQWQLLIKKKQETLKKKNLRNL